SELGERLRLIDFSYPAENFPLPCTGEDTSRVLSDILIAALETPHVHRVSMSVGQRPGCRQLTVAAHYASPVAPPTVVTIGKPDSECDPAAFPSWPAHSSATRFDNGFDRVFQISVRTPEAPGQIFTLS